MAEYYWTCPFCNANLDPGESCDCRKEVENSELLIEHETPTTKSSDVDDDYKVVEGGANE